MQLMVPLLADIYVRGWMTDSGFIQDIEVRLILAMNGCRRLRLCLTMHLARVRIVRV